MLKAFIFHEFGDKLLKQNTCLQCQIIPKGIGSSLMIEFKD